MKKNNLRKSIISMLCIVSMLAFYVVPASAAGDVTLTVGTVPAAAVDTIVTIPITASEVGDITAFGFKIDYDMAKLEFIGWDWSDTVVASIGAPNITSSDVGEVNDTDKKLAAAYASGNAKNLLQNYTLNGIKDLAKIQFKVLAPGANITVPVALSATPGEVSVDDETPKTVTRVDGGLQAAPVAVTGVTLDNATLSLIAGGTTGTLTETVNPAEATNKAVTWSSNNEAVATVANGVVTPLTAGTATITVTTVDGTKTATSTVTVKDVSTILFADGATVSKVYNTTGYTNTISGDGDGTVTYTSSTPATATINSSGEVTLVGVGTTVITATKAATSTHATVTNTYTLTVTAAPSTIVFTDGTAVSKNYGTTGYTNTISGDGTGAVTYTSGTPAIATINSSTGVVTLVGVGETVITATKAATLTHATVTNTYTLTVTVVEITAFDAIANVSAGTAGSATYADAAAVITALPTTATANTSAVTVPVTTWVDTDTYNPAVAGSYTFTATLGTIPTGYANAGGFTATVEVVVAPVSSGGSSGGGSSSIQPTAPAANGTIQVNYTATGGTAVLALPRSKVDEIIAKSKNGEVDIDLSKVSGITSAELPKTAVTAINEAGVDVTVKFPAGSITLKKDATVSIVGQAEGGSLKLELKQVAKRSLTDEQKEAVKSNDLVLDINISSGTKKISSFDGTLSITVPYSGPQPVAVWYLNDKGELEKLFCTFVDGTVSFNLDHLSLYVVGQDTAWVNPFADVKESDWFYGSVEYAFKNGLMVGTSDTTFSPYKNTTRGMIVTILHRLEGRPKSDAANAFTDVGADKYYTDAVAWARDNIIVSGYGNGMFGPEDSITREQMAVILMNYAKYKGYDISMKADLSKFSDEESISPWAKDAISWANAEGLIQGSGSQLMPVDNALRCQVAAILQRFIETIAK